MVARQDAPVVWQGDYLSGMLDGHDDQSIKLRLGRMVETFSLASKLKDKA